jgi:magnesium transporter
MKQVALEKLLKITRQFIKLRTYGHLWNALNRLHYADIATLFENLNAEEITIIVDLYLDKKKEVAKLAEVFSEVKPEISVDILSQYDIKKITQILNELSSDDAASLIPLFSEDIQNQILKEMKEDGAEDVREQLAYSEESAGRIMSSDFLALHEDTPVKDAITAIQEAGENVDVPFYLYVVDEDKRLAGVVSLKQLILVKKDLALKEIMISKVYKVDAYTDQEEVARVVADYNLLAIPVVDEHDKLIGVVTVDDIVDIIQEEATEDIYKLTGVTQDYSVQLPLLSSIRKRIPWLMMSLITTSVSALVVAAFKGTIETFIQVAILMHIVPAIGGVLGNQTIAIMVREIVLGGMDFQKSKRILFKESVVSVGSGLLIAMLATPVTYLAFNRWVFGLIFGGAIIFNLLFATFFGTLIPLVLKILKIDPALASGMIVSMLTDAFGLLCFLGLSSLFL